jgi:chloramphenicol O-acetyltransferase
MEITKLTSWYNDAVEVSYTVVSEDNEEFCCLTFNELKILGAFIQEYIQKSGEAAL